MKDRIKERLTRYFSDYGMIVALFVLCVFFSYITWEEQTPQGASAARDVAEQLQDEFRGGANVLIAARNTGEDVEFAEMLSAELEGTELRVVATVTGSPAEARQALENLAREETRLDAIAATETVFRWAVLRTLSANFPAFQDVRMVTPERYSYPNFLKPDNLFNVANQIVVIAVLAIGMTMVIITGGIDLSVGSLIALAAVFSAMLIRDVFGAEEATVLGMIAACIGGILLCALLGAFTGLMVTLFSIPPFIVTLGMMLVASGLAYILADGQSIYQIPQEFVWLGRGTGIFGIPIAVMLMVVLYAIAHVIMSQTVLGRYIYAIGGNTEAARLSGVPVFTVLVTVYTVGAALAGLGGVITASQLKSGSPTYGLMYELYVIAAVVVGGTSLAGGEGKILGTLIGAFIIAVIQNGMNLMGIESYTQKVVFGLVILGAVLLDQLKRKGGRFLSLRGKGAG